MYLCVSVSLGVYVSAWVCICSFLAVVVDWPLPGFGVSQPVLSEMLQTEAHAKPTGDVDIAFGFLSCDKWGTPFY